MIILHGKVSVIVPVYNAEPFLDACLEHLLEQTYSNMEVILVDSCSTDASLEVCKTYESRYENVKVAALPENLGPGAARNMGLELATGEYVCFCDADDYFHTDAVEKLLGVLKKTDADYVVADMYAERISARLGLPWENGTVFTGRQIREQMIPLYIGNRSDNDKSLPVWGSVVKCIFKLQVIRQNQLRFPDELRFAEDLVFTLRYLSCANKAAVLDEVVYFYRYNGQSLMNSYRNYHPEMWKARRELIEEIKLIMTQLDIMVENTDRLHTTARLYIKESIGNAGKRPFRAAYKEVREILNEKVCREAFLQFDAKEKKNKILYSFIKYRCVLTLTVYYGLRAGGHR